MALGDLVGVSASQGLRAYDNNDGTYTLQVITTTGTPTSSVVSRYTAVNSFGVPTPGANIGDIIQSVSNYNADTGALLSTVWLNITQGTTLAGAPAPTDITPLAAGNPYGTQFFEYIATGSTTPAVAIGDVVQQAVNTDLVSNSEIYTWFNVTKGTVLTGANIPLIGNLTPATVIANKKYTSAQYLYTVSTSFGGNNVGDIMSRYDIIDGSGATQVLVSTSWTNVSTGNPYIGAVNYSNLEAGEFLQLPASAASLTNVTNAGTTAVGAIQIGFANVGAANATVAGSTLLPGTSLEFTAPRGGSIAPIAYDATGTTLAIATLV